MRGGRSSPISDESAKGRSAAPTTDQVLEHVRAMCLLEEEERVMLADDVILSLSKSVGAWQEVWLSAAVDKQPFDCNNFQYLMLTALVCSAHSQVS